VVAELPKSTSLLLVLWLLTTMTERGVTGAEVVAVRGVTVTRSSASSTASSGALTVIEVTAALNITVPASSTMGFANATPGRLWLVAVAGGAVGQKARLAEGPQQVVQMLDALGRAGPHDDAMSGGERAFQDAGQRPLQRHGAEMVEADLGHARCSALVVLPDEVVE
jgi:hypothetical protein